MQLHTPWLALGLLTVAIPIIIHIMTRQSGRTVDWGAILFLRDSLVIRNRRIRLEEALLMAARCLVLALLALALARPFIPPGGSTPWFLVLPMFFIGAVAIGISIVMWDLILWRFILLGGGTLLVALAALMMIFENQFNLSRFSKGGRQDVALIIDASTSMALDYEGKTNFDRAIEEARTIVKRSPRGNAFSLILGGPTPSARMLMPTSDRDLVLQQLDDVRPLEGGMATYDCFTLASLGLAQGSNPSKQVIIITDGQNVGWETNKPARWSFLKDAFANLASTPKVILRQLSLPSHLRNLALADISYSRNIVGIDRPVKVSVTVENTGSEAVSPKGVEFLVDGQTFTDQTLGQILPGSKETIQFQHQFKNYGAHEVRARVLVDDEIVQDNESSSALNIVGKLRILIVDGNPSGRFFDRAASFIALALAPGTQIMAPAQPGSEEEAMRFLVEPQLTAAADLRLIPTFDAYDAVLLADVPMLPRDIAQKLDNYLKQGGGVLVAAGARSTPDFYNTWTSADGKLVMPARLTQQVVPDTKEPPVGASLDTFRHPSVRVIANRTESDFETGVFSHYWKLEENPGTDAVVGGRLNNGDAYLMARKAGLGNLIMLGSSLDLRAGNLPSRQAFLPFIHEIVYFLANPGNYELNLEPKWELALHLAGNEHAVAGHGLKGEYFASQRDSKPKLERLDPGIQFHWHSGSPAEGIPVDNFRVHWSGKLQPPKSGNYRFDAQADDFLRVTIDGRPVLSIDRGRRPEAREVRLEAGRMHSIQVDLQEESGDAYATLFWESRDVPREIVPPSAFRSFTGDDKDNVVATYPVTGPAGEKRQAKIAATAGGAVAKIQGDVAAGTYRIHVPEGERSKFRELLGETGSIIPFTVKRDPAESRLQPLTAADKAFLANYVGLVEPDTPEDVIEILSGQSFGEELWKLLAVGALGFLLLEIALSRWIALSRQAGEDASVRFATGGGPGEAFKQQLNKVKVKSGAPA